MGGGDGGVPRTAHCFGVGLPDGVAGSVFLHSDGTVVVDAFRAASDGASRVVPRRPRCAAPRDGARICCANLVGRRSSPRVRGRAKRPPMSWIRPFSARQNPSISSRKSASKFRANVAIERCNGCRHVFRRSRLVRCRRSASVTAGAERALSLPATNALIAVRNLRIALPSTSITAPTSAAMKLLPLTTLLCLAHAGKKTVRKRVPTTPRRRRLPAPTANYTLR